MHAYEHASSYTAYTLHDRAGTRANIYVYNSRAGVAIESVHLAKEIDF